MVQKTGKASIFLVARLRLTINIRRISFVFLWHGYHFTMFSFSVNPQQSSLRTERSKLETKKPRFTPYVRKPSKETKHTHVYTQQVKYGEAGREFGTLVADRTVGNMMEQSFLFLVNLVLHASLVNVSSAVSYGWIWLLSRTYYPYAFYKGAPILFLSTFPGYCALLGLFYPVLQMIM